jgi:hypothetical protein
MMQTRIWLTVGLVTFAALGALAGPLETASAAGTAPCGLDDPVDNPWPYCCPDPWYRQNVGALCVPGKSHGLLP